MQHSTIVCRKIGSRYRNMRAESVFVREVIDVLTVKRTIDEGAVNNGFGRKVSGDEMPTKPVICWPDLVRLQIW